MSTLLKPVSSGRHREAVKASVGERIEDRGGDKARCLLYSYEVIDDGVARVVAPRIAPSPPPVKGGGF